MKYAGWLMVLVVAGGAFAGWHFYLGPQKAAAVSAAAAAAPPPATHTAFSPPAAPEPPRPPDLPVSVTRRPSTVGRGFVGQVRNDGDTYLRLAVTYTDVTTGRTTTGKVEVGPRATVELGWLEGCPLATGDTLTLSHPTFTPKSWQF